MSITNSTILVGAAVTATGGTAMTLSLGGKDIANGINLIDASESDIRVQTNATFKVKSPTLLSDSTYGKGRKEVSLVKPFVDSNSKQQFPLGRVQIEHLPEKPEDITTLRIELAQLIVNPDYDSFWLSGALS